MKIYMPITKHHVLTIYAELSSFLNDKLSIFWFKEIQDGILPVERRVWAIKSWTWVYYFVPKVMSYLVLTFASRVLDIQGTPCTEASIGDEFRRTLV